MFSPNHREIELLIGESLNSFVVHIRKQFIEIDPPNRNFQSGILAEEIQRRRKKRKFTLDEIWNGLFASCFLPHESTPFVIDPSKIRIHFYPLLLYWLEADKIQGKFKLEINLDSWNSKIQKLGIREKICQIERFCDWMESYLSLSAYMLYKKNRCCFGEDEFASYVNNLVTRSQDFPVDQNLAWRGGVDSLREIFKNNQLDYQIARLVKEAPSDWETPLLDAWLFKVWPLVKHYDYTSKELLGIIVEVKDFLKVDLEKYPCKPQGALSTHYRTVLGLRHNNRPLGYPSRSGLVKDIPLLQLAETLAIDPKKYI